MFDNRPIGIFDSGVGGLSVLRALRTRLPGESTIYLGDLARCPYGPRPQTEVRTFALQIAYLLLQYDIKMLVVACNTATAAAIELLQADLDVPVIGVVHPGASTAVRVTRSGRIGVIATDGTVSSGAYVRAVREHMASAVVVQRPASWLVPLVERGVLARAQIALQLAPILSDMRAHQIDTLILGCTHFPLVGDIFEAETGPHITVVDSASTTAGEVAQVLQASGLCADRVPSHRLLVTGPAEAFAERAQAMFRVSPEIETVELTALHVR